MIWFHKPPLGGLLTRQTQLVPAAPAAPKAAPAAPKATSPAEPDKSPERQCTSVAWEAGCATEAVQKQRTSPGLTAPNPHAMPMEGFGLVYMLSISWQWEHRAQPGQCDPSDTSGNKLQARG